jgi:hypothetical protein
VLENKSSFGSKSGNAQETNANGKPIESISAASSSMGLSGVVMTLAAIVAVAMAL